MADAKNFAASFSQKQPSSRSLTDPVPEEEELEQTPQTSPEQMIDALYYILMQRLDHIEHMIEEIDCLCRKK